MCSLSFIGSNQNQDQNAELLSNEIKSNFINYAEGIRIMRLHEKAIIDVEEHKTSEIDEDEKQEKE